MSTGWRGKHVFLSAPSLPPSLPPSQVPLLHQPHCQHGRLSVTENSHMRMFLKVIHLCRHRCTVVLIVVRLPNMALTPVVGCKTTRCSNNPRILLWQNQAGFNCNGWIEWGPFSVRFTNGWLFIISLRHRGLEELLGVRRSRETMELCASSSVSSASPGVAAGETGAVHRCVGKSIVYDWHIQTLEQSVENGNSWTRFFWEVYERWAGTCKCALGTERVASTAKSDLGCVGRNRIKVLLVVWIVLHRSWGLRCCWVALRIQREGYSVWERVLSLGGGDVIPLGGYHSFFLCGGTAVAISTDQNKCNPQSWMERLTRCLWCYWAVFLPVEGTGLLNTCFVQPGVSVLN